MIEIDILKITDVRENKLFYYDENENIDFIDLDLCAKYHEKQTGKVFDASLRSVGEREYPYYYLYSPDNIRLYLKPKPQNAIKRFISKTLGWCFDNKEFALWYSIQKKLNKNGWSTLDLS